MFYAIRVSKQYASFTEQVPEVFGFVLFLWLQKKNEIIVSKLKHVSRRCRIFNDKTIDHVLFGEISGKMFQVDIIRLRIQLIF